MTGLTAQSHVALHHWVPCHGAHWGRRRDCRNRQTGRRSVISSDKNTGSMTLYSICTLGFNPLLKSGDFMEQ